MSGFKYGMFEARGDVVAVCRIAKEGVVGHCASGLESGSERKFEVMVVVIYIPVQLGTGSVQVQKLLRQGNRLSVYGKG